MDNWLLAAIMALLFYGFWGFFPKLAINYISPENALVFEVAGAVLVGLITLVQIRFQLDMHPKGIAFAVLTGIAGMLGTLCYLFAASKGRIAIVVTLTALYPLITIILAAVFLREPVSIKQIGGMIFALLAIILLAT